MKKYRSGHLNPPKFVILSEAKDLILNGSEQSQTARRHRPGPSAVTTPRISTRSNLSADPSLSKNSTPSPTNPANPSAVPTKPNAA